MTNKLHILGLCILLCFSFQSLAEEPPTLFKGSVVEMESGEKIKGAVITLEKDGEVIKTITTDESGNFELEYEEESETKGELKLKITKPGFSAKNIESLKNIDCNLKLELKKKVKRQKPVILPAGPNNSIEI